MDDIEACLSCGLPDCNEKDPGCRLRRLRWKSPWRDEVERVAGMVDGERTRLGPVRADRAVRLQEAVYKVRRRAGLPGVRTRVVQVEEGLVEVEVWCGGDLPVGLHWSRWADQLAQVAGLGEGEEVDFALSTEEEVGNLQSSLSRLRRYAGVQFRTARRRDGAGKLYLKVKRGAALRSQ